MSAICELVVTAPDPDWAADYVRRLVEARLAACGHQFPIRSIYRWDGQIHDTTETRIALHTQPAHVDRITQITLDEHPYDVPCIIVQPITEASADYQAWVLDSTSTSAS